jgi:hypothetical protein
LLFFFVLGFSYLITAKRLFLLWPLLTVVIGFSVYVRPIRIASAPWALAIASAFGFSTVLLRIFLPASVANVTIDLGSVSWANGSLADFYFYSPEYATFEMITLSVAKADEVANLFGGVIDAFYVTNIQPLFYIVPRVIWPSKPDIFLDISHALTALISGLPVTAVTYGIAGTVIGTSWVFAGLFGTAAAMVGLGVFCAKVDRRLRLPTEWSPYHVVWFAFLLTLVFHIFRQGTLGWVFMITIVQQFGLIGGFCLISWQALTKGHHHLSRIHRHTVEKKPTRVTAR